jgi:hypothetical protein
MNKRMRGDGADLAVSLVRGVRAIAGTSGRSGIVVIANRSATMLYINRFGG